jgi:RNAse (barnase) inhibitor barstar
MAWQVAIVLDAETDVESLLGMMPVWAVTTPDRNANAKKDRESWDSLWFPEPGLTLWSNSFDKNNLDSLPRDISTVEEHHPYVACLRIFGLAASERLIAVMTELGYLLLPGAPFPSLDFGRSVDDFPDVCQIVLDATDWSSRDDFYSAFFQAVGAPTWHGRNFNALVDSIQTGRINQVEVPYQILVQNSVGKNPEIQEILSNFVDLVHEMQANGCPVSLSIEA